MSAPSELVLLRHGQAAYGSANYDVLSERGVRQCQAVARHWLALERDWTGVWRGTLDRHRDSLVAVERVYATAGRALPEAVVDPDLNEHPGIALMRSHMPTDRASLDAMAALAPAQQQRAWFGHYRTVMTDWLAGRIGADGVDPWPVVSARILAAIDRAGAAVRECGGRGLVVTSGGVAAIAATRALGLAPERFLELSLRLGNAARVHLHLGRSGPALLAFNDTAGLDHPELHTFV
jgi:broad specificity phosphatase PhoE